MKAGNQSDPKEFIATISAEAQDRLATVGVYFDGQLMELTVQDLGLPPVDREAITNWIRRAPRPVTPPTPNDLALLCGITPAEEQLDHGENDEEADQS